ncbi:MAG: PEP-CTERM sorting domain-containing protein, partial [Planctomycetes bacterium]|nr:PEP-CTERM sorting domain-containing protein [Planctomycetota bacterium]
ATFIVEQTLDITQPQSNPSFQGWQDTPAFNGGFSVTMGAGDTFDYRIQFLPGQSLTVTNLSFLWAYSYSSGPPTDVNGTGQISLLDANGIAFLTSDLKTDDEGEAHFGQNFFSSDFSGGIPATVTFYGVEYVGTINSYANPLVTTRPYDEPAFYFGADSTIINSVVPEPSSFVLMSFAGLGMALVAFRRR